MEYRVSSYLLDAPLEATGGEKHMILHGYTGAIDIIDIFQR